MDPRTKLQASARNPDSVCPSEFYSRQPLNIRRPVALLSKNTTFFWHIFFGEPKRDRDFRQELTNSVLFDKPQTGNCLPRFGNVSDSGGDLTSRARSARNASALRWKTISGRRLCPSEHLSHRFCG